MKSYRLPLPLLSWGDDGAPKSNQFDDIYFDSESGIKESQFVFLQHNQLLTRWDDLTSQHFTIAETGFGTGLNFLCTWQAWQQAKNTQAQPPKTLHFISVEKYPLTKAMLSNALKMWPSLASLSAELIAHYPEVCHGFHRISLDHGRVQLSLWFGEASEGFAALNADVDAWFLDGFAPSKNPAMWSAELFKQIHRLSHVGTSFATFTAAGIVRRGLQEVGFTVNRVKGFGKKREMLIGELHSQPLSFAQRTSEGQPWFNVRHTHYQPVTKVLVVGAGLAGCHTAYQLARQGIQVELWEQHKSIAAGASGNPQGMLYPKLASQDTPINRFYLTAFLQTSRWLDNFDTQGDIWQRCGLVQKPANAKEQQRFQKMLTNEMYPSSVLQQHQDTDDLLLPLGGWVKPQALCQALLNHPNIQLHLSKPLTQLEQDKDNQKGQWLAHSTDQSCEAFSQVVLCQANATSPADDLLSLPRISIRGQVSSLMLSQPLELKQVLCQQGYVSPALPAGEKHILHFGSSYGIRDTNPDVTLIDHQENLAKLAQLLPTHNWSDLAHQCAGRVSFRCTIPDYSPIVGPVFNEHQLTEKYQRLQKNAKWKSEDMLDSLTGLYINIGHGSRGLISTPLCADYICSLILQQPSPFERTIEKALHPSRFAVKQLKRS